MLVSEKHALHNTGEETLYNTEYGGSRFHKIFKAPILNYTVTFQKHMVLQNVRHKSAHTLIFFCGTTTQLGPRLRGCSGFWMTHN